MEEILIAVVDDDASVGEAIKRLLQSHGFTVQTFNSAEQFLRNGKLNDIACLVLDMLMPGMNGLELQQHLALMSSQIPIVFVSGTTAAAFYESALRAGAVACLQKPIIDDNLLRAVRAALKRRGSSDN